MNMGAHGTTPPAKPRRGEAGIACTASNKLQ
jgi:hypothetical protein